MSSRQPAKKRAAYMRRPAQRRVQRADASLIQDRQRSTQEFLSDASEVLNSSLNYDETLKRLADLAIKSLADWCIIFLLEEGSSAPKTVAIGHPDSLHKSLVEEMSRKYPIDWGQAGGPGEVFRSGISQLNSEITEERLRTTAQSPEHLDFLHRLHLVSSIFVPIRVRDRVIGAIGMVSTATGTRYGSYDLQIAEELGRRAGIAIDNAILYREAQKAVQLREDVVAVVSHDLRNPLGSVKLNSQLIERAVLKNPVLAVIQPQIERIIRSTGQMERLIEDILDLTKFRAGKLELTLSEEPIHSLLHEVVEMFEPQAEQKNIRLRLDVDPNCCTVSVDHARMHQVFSNLIGNAIKFMSAEGEIAIGAREDPGEAVFWVADTGPGIPGEDQEKIFSRFWQSPKFAEMGIGLGLSVAKAIVERHGGRIWVESEAGRGSKFYFTVPKSAV
jgi:signal transduction histidine kinase